MQEAVVGIQRKRGTLEITVVDHGAGFDPEVPSTSGESAGLLGMRERAGLLGGGLTIEAAFGQGTRLLCVLPLKHHTRAPKGNGDTTFIAPVNDQLVRRRTGSTTR